MVVIKRFSQVAFVVLLLGAIWAHFIEPNRVQETQIRLAIPNLPSELEGFKIVQISDIHIETFGRREHAAVAIANRNKPDVIALTGDYAGGAWGDRTDKSTWELVSMLRSLKARRAIYAVWGDWDYSPILRKRVAMAGVTPLFNTGQTLHVGKANIAFLGLGLNITDLTGALAAVAPNSIKILLCHEARAESVDDAAESGIDVTLIGGEHGGQVCLPLLGPVRAAQPENYGREYMSGLHRVHDRMILYANRGLGMSDYALRFLCPPEVAVFTLTRASKPNFQ